MSSVLEAISKLKTSGLFAAESQARVGDIVGGTAFSRDGEIGIYKNAFSISLEEGNWIARASGDGQSIDEFMCADLDAAVALIIEIFRSR